MRDDDRAHGAGRHTTADAVGEAAGGISGAVTGAAIGSVAGPVGTVIGGIAGAVGGWWAGREIAEMATDLAQDDDRYFRTHYETSSGQVADRRYEDVRPIYQIGHLAGLNPDYTGREFDEVEHDLKRGWTSDSASRLGEWPAVRSYAREGFARGRTVRANPDHPLWKNRARSKAEADARDDALGAAEATTRRDVQGGTDAGGGSGKVL